MSKQNQVFPRIWTTTKNAWKIYWNSAKYFIVDAGMMIISVIAFLYWWFVNSEASMVGAVAILFAYSTYTAIRLNWSRKEKKELQRKLDEK